MLFLKAKRSLLSTSSEIALDYLRQDEDVWVRAVLKRAVVGDRRFDNPSGSHLQSQVKSVCQWIAS